MKALIRCAALRLGYDILQQCRDADEFPPVSRSRNRLPCRDRSKAGSLEIYGRDGTLHVEGLGGSSGVERLAYYKMLPEMGPPETTIWEYPGADRPWQVEFDEFLEDIRLGRQPAACLAAARAALVVGTIQRRSG